MSLHDPAVTLSQMTQYAADAVRYGAGKSTDELDADPVLLLALTRLVEVLGEAATRLDQDFRDSHPSIPWRQIIGMRNILIHGYDVASTDVLREVIAVDLPKLLPELQRIQESLSRSD